MVLVSFASASIKYILNATFLDLDITDVDGIYEFKFCDKRDNYLFFIVRLPDLGGNIPAYVFYDWIPSEFPRIAKCISKFSDFVPKGK